MLATLTNPCSRVAKGDMSYWLLLLFSTGANSVLQSIGVYYAHSINVIYTSCEKPALSHTIKELSL